MAQMSDAQFQQLLKTIIEAKTGPAQGEPTAGSFSTCSARFDRDRSFSVVDNFLRSIDIYKNIEKISDADALKGLPLLLNNTAATWWQGVKEEAKCWSEALTLIRGAFSPSKPAHQLYMDIFSKRQEFGETIDEFICGKRVLLAQLPLNRHDEEIQLDIIFGLLHISYRKEISRNNIHSFVELLQKGREIEMVRNECFKAKPMNTQNEIPIQERQTGKQRKARCSYCHLRGHMVNECTKRIACEEKENLTRPAQENGKPSTTSHSGMVCYGCGKVGYFRSNCPTCSPRKEIPTQAVQFYSIHTLLNPDTPVLTIKVTVKGIPGLAHIDTAAKTSIASKTLYEHLKKIPGVEFYIRSATVTLADGSRQTTKILHTTVEIQVGNRTLDINFVVLSDAEDNRTLLGIDFLEKAAMVLMLPQRAWFYADEPTKT
ncbi:hypothetical protein ABEB36_015660 [Hypothenemus hampei]|uniref:CCHC-type domain-containing protein n=1 Tax=Hypothenemus hampei TaxID=57062 RepID=A0ABD1DZ51_HYPHA